MRKKWLNKAVLPFRMIHGCELHTCTLFGCASGQVPKIFVCASIDALFINVKIVVIVADLTIEGCARLEAELKLQVFKFGIFV